MVKINLVDQMLTWIYKNGDLTKAFLASHEFSAWNLILEEKNLLFFPSFRMWAKSRMKQTYKERYLLLSAVIFHHLVLCIKWKTTK